MTKCESHEDIVKLVDKTDKRVDVAFKKIDDLREDLNAQISEQRETDVYVKNLYKRFDDLTTQMQIVITRLDTYIVTLTTIQNETQHNVAANKRGKDLVFEIIKWIVLLGLGMLLTTENAI